MLYPKENAYRETKELSGFWQYRFDRDETGRDSAWPAGFDADGDMPVPASWNELFSDMDRMYFLGTCWYQRRAFVPKAWAGRRVVLRVGAVSYRAEVWVNGQRIGGHEGCQLPFEFAIDEYVKFGQENLFVIAVNAELTPDTLPVGNVTGGEGHSTLMKPYPNVEFDFFPYGGIHRPVTLYTTDPDHIANVAVDTAIDGTTGRVSVRVEAVVSKADRVQLEIAGQAVEAKLADGAADATIDIPDAKLWSPDSPHLYELTARLLTGEAVVDEYALSVGVRTVEVAGDQILLNGEPIHLRGFGKHEDFAVIGKGLNLAVMTKDYDLMKWIGANSFRTTHYPYAEEMLDMADRLGFLVISETPAVGINFEYDTTELKKAHHEVIDQWIRRDRNHPSVIMWCVSNEPRSDKPGSDPYFADLLAHTRSLDASRPLTVVTCDGEWVARGKCHVMQHCDVICINRYYGWYVGAGRIDESIENMSRELDDIHAEFGRPIIITEFGADCVAGLHALPSFVFSEEYQAELIEKTIKMCDTKDFVVGEHIWNFADFLTGQVHSRVGGNKKGVFTRDRQPKLAAHVVKRLWTE